MELSLEGYEAGKVFAHDYRVWAREFIHEVKELDSRRACIHDVLMVQVNL